MSLRAFLVCSVCFIIAVGLLIFGSTMLDRINTQRSEMKLVMNEPLENAPPSLAFATVALGAFRGLIVDILWLRAEQLKEEGKFFDARQLAEWITILQPRFASVWNFHAWNMAYNISVAIPATRPQERWQWVKNGFELLRDKGIPKNPRSILLYHELGWIFQHKIGDIMDDAHIYYKLQLYNAMHPLLGPQTQEYYKQLANAPKELGEILTDPDIADFVQALTAADSAFEKTNAVQFVENYLTLRQQPQKFAPQAFEVIDNYRNTKALENFDIFAKAYYLRNVWKLEPELMVELNEKYGPVDYKDPNRVLPLNWEHPDAHAIYWAYLGLKRASRASQKEYSIDELNTDRIVFHSIQNLYRRGKMIVYTAKVPSENDPCSLVTRQSVFLFPDLRMFDRYDQILTELKEKYAEIEGNVESLEIAHRNMLKRAVLLFYQAGHTSKALEIYNTLRKKYPNDDDVKVPLIDYARNRLIAELSMLGMNDAREIITLMLHEAYYRYAVGDDDEAFGREKMAKEVYDYYQKEYGKKEGTDRIMLPDFEIMRYVAIVNFLNDLRYPDFIRRNLMDRIQIERPELFERLKQQSEYFMREMEKQESMQQ